MNGYCTTCGNYGFLDDAGNCAYCRIIIEELDLDTPDLRERGPD